MQAARKCIFVLSVEKLLLESAGPETFFKYNTTSHVILHPPLPATLFSLPGGHMTRQLLATLACGLCAIAAHAANPLVEIKTNLGEIVLELDAERAPKTVDNFLRYVRDGHYNGTVFHRVIKGFMIQGGGMDETLTEKKARAPIENEADNGLKNETGTVAMARTNLPHSAKAQFFINVADNEFLDFRAKDSGNWGYAVFGKVIEGMDIVRKIERRPTHSRGLHENVPVDAVVIESARIILAAEREKAPDSKAVSAPAPAQAAKGKSPATPKRNKPKTQ
jgi:peptidyl-prolyl cis-trans isomerase A (cyclophilin A)